jgi:peptidoglycan hydrolase-like protein with peptidoglycan-binding domain
MPAEAFSEGSVDPQVRALQDALARRGFQTGPIDGEFGPLTRAAVISFQTVQGLPATGSADEATLRALGIAMVPKPAPGTPVPAGGAGTVDTAQLLQVVLAALAEKQPGARTTTPTTTAPPTTLPVLSPIDRLLGGEALTGKKTALAVVAYAVLAILQAVGVVGAATPAGQVLTVVITAFGALGGLAKVDRGIQALGTIAAKPPA